MFFQHPFPYWQHLIAYLPSWLLLTLLIRFFLKKLPFFSSQGKWLLLFPQLLSLIAGIGAAGLLMLKISSLPLPGHLPDFYQVRHIPSADQLSAAAWLATFYNVWSLPWVGMLLLVLWEKSFSCQLWRPSDWRDFWQAGAGGALLLYPAGLGLGNIDPYSWGWYKSPLTLFLLLLGVYWIIKKSRVLPLLLLTFFLYHLHLEPTSNLWDYLIDPLYGAVAFIAVIIQLPWSLWCNKLLQKRGATTSFNDLS